MSASYLDCPIQTCQNTCLLAGNMFYSLSKYRALIEVRKHFPLCQKSLEDFLNSWAQFPSCKQWSKTGTAPWQRVEGSSSIWRGGNGCDCNSNAKLLDLTYVQKKMLPITSQNWWLSITISPQSIYSRLSLSLERLERAQSGQITQRPTVPVLWTHRMKYGQRNKKISISAIIWNLFYYGFIVCNDLLMIYLTC